MSTKRTIGGLLTIMLLILSITACRPENLNPTKNTGAAETSDFYRFEDTKTARFSTSKRSV